MGNLHESPAICKRKSRYTPLAHAVRFAILAGITDVAELARELECTQSAIYRAKKQLEDTDRVVTTDRTVKSDRTELTVQSQTDRTVTKTDQSVTRASRACANTELPSGVVIPESNNNNSREREEGVVVASLDYQSVRVACSKAAGETMRLNSAGIHDMSPIMGLIEAGADLGRDVLPTIARLAMTREPQSVTSWKFYSRAIADAFASRKAGISAIATARPARGEPAPFRVSPDTVRYAKPAPGSEYIPEAANA